MFAYIKVFDDTNSTYGYVSFSFSKHDLLIKRLRGSLATPEITIPIEQIKIVNEDFYNGWNRIHFNYNGTHYLFIYSAYGEYNYFKQHMFPVEMV